MSEVDFLVGQKVIEIRYPGLRIVFDPGDRVEPALYADLGEFTLTSSEGVEQQVDAEDPTTLSLCFGLSARRSKRRRLPTTLRWN